MVTTSVFYTVYELLSSFGGTVSYHFTLIQLI